MDIRKIENEINRRLATAQRQRTKALKYFMRPQSGMYHDLMAMAWFNERKANHLKALLQEQGNG